jgi:hypothetical protein
VSRRAYRTSPIKWARATRAEIESRRRTLFEIIQAMRPMTVRRAFYQATVRGLSEKTEGGYAKAQTDLAIMRKERWLCSLEDAPWNALKGKPITDNQLARRLKQYEVKPKTLRLERNVIAKGYVREDLHDVWRRYLPSPPDEPLTAVTDVTTQSFQDRGETGDALRASQGPLQPLRNASDGASVTKAVTACNVSITPGKRQKIEDLTDVTPVTPSAEGGRASHRAERPAGMRAIGYGALISPNPPRRRTRI